MNFVRLKHEIEEVKEKTKSFTEFCSQIGGEISEKVKETVGDLFCNVDADNLKGTVPGVFATMISTEWKEPNDLILKIVHGYHDGGKESYEALTLRNRHNDAYYIRSSYGDTYKVNWKQAKDIEVHKYESWRNLNIIGRGDMEQLSEDEAIQHVSVGTLGKRSEFPTTWEDWSHLVYAVYRVEWPLMEKLDKEMDEIKAYRTSSEEEYI
jgi:hypothetical protein